MPTSLPYSEGAHIVQPNQAAEYLALMGIDIADIHESLAAGETASANTRTSAPVTAAGSRRWFDTTEVLRDHLRTKHNWNLTDPQNRPLASHPIKKYTLGIIGGNEDTGNPDVLAKPRANRAKGKATEQAVNSGDPVLFVLNAPEDQKATSVTNTPPEGDWFLLYYRAENELRCEVSLPYPNFKDGQFGDWQVRVLLQPIPFDTAIENIRDIGGGEIDFKIA
ncbi:hypothetical protein IDM48_10380 [Rothia amarae]|uniref:Uncharacterized protein n=1 Tax=Rothia amarae TaxID=169480 RepID=A0A7H2BJ97_9MICC|nr:hypothetical protein [Rothia amarae]QNV39743.1 hypothetical protein IDM48_10380 [Rothia amarae]